MEARSHFDAGRWVTFLKHVAEKIEENLLLVDGIRGNEFMISFIIDLTKTNVKMMTFWMRG